LASGELNGALNVCNIHLSGEVTDSTFVCELHAELILTIGHLRRE